MFKKLLTLWSGLVMKDAGKKHALHSGHWQCPLDGHGLSYLDELVGCYRTLPALTASEQAAAEAAKTAAAKARAAGEAHAQAAVDAEAAQKDAEANPTDQAKQNLAATKVKDAAKAKTELDAANEAAVNAQAAVIPRTAAALIIQELISRPREKLLWSDVLLLESALLRMLPSEALRARLALLREDYQRVAGALPSISRLNLDLKDSLDEATEKALRAEADLLLGELHWAYLTQPVIERQKTLMTRNLFLFAGFLCVGAAFGLCSDKWSIWAAIVISGAVGAALSAFQRLQSPQLRTEAFLNVRRSAMHTLSWIAAPILGSISAVILALAFAGGLVQGGLFPHLEFVKPSDCTNGVSTLGGPAVQREKQTNVPPADATATSPRPGAPVQPPAAATTNGASATAPSGPGDPCPDVCGYCWCLRGRLSLPLLLIWSVIAGFSERLVPDILSRLTGRVRERS